MNKELFYLLLQWYLFILIIYYYYHNGFGDIFMFIGLWLIPSAIGVRSLYRILIEED